MFKHVSMSILVLIGWLFLFPVSVKAAATAQGVSLNTTFADCNNGAMSVTYTTVNASREYGSFSTLDGGILYSFEQATPNTNFSGTTTHYGIPGVGQPEGTIIISYAYIGETPPSPADTAEFMVIYRCSNSGANTVLHTCYGAYGTCSYGGSNNNLSEDTIVYPPDDRINWQYGDLSAIAYHHEDGGVVVYCYDGETTWSGMLVNQAVIDGIDPEQVQGIAILEYENNGCHTAFFILDTGEYQINIWYDGKIYEIIADNIDFENPTLRYYDPGE